MNQSHNYKFGIVGQNRSTTYDWLHLGKKNLHWPEKIGPEKCSLHLHHCYMNPKAFYPSPYFSLFLALPGRVICLRNSAQGAMFRTKNSRQIKRSTFVILHEGTCPTPQELTHYSVMEEEEGLVGPAKHGYNTGPQGETVTCQGWYWPMTPGITNPRLESLPIRNLMDCKENNYFNSIQLPHPTKPGGSFL